MAIAPPSSYSFSASFCCTSSEQVRISHFSSTAGICYGPNRPPSRPMCSSRLYSSKPSGANGSVHPDNGDLPYELQHGFPSPWRKGSPVFVTLPVDASVMVMNDRDNKKLFYSLRAIRMAGVEGVVMEVWWGLVETSSPMIYNWKGYRELVSLVRRCGLKIRAVMAFHQWRTGTGDSHWIPLPQWVRQEIDRDPDLLYSDRFGRRNQEYISLGCDMLPVLKGRSPMQIYSDFMRSFKYTFMEFLGITITGIQVGMGPAGELKYPSYPSKKLELASDFPEISEFQCYDKYMLASLYACLRETGRLEWESGGPMDAGKVMSDPKLDEFFTINGSWDTPDGRFFLEWYSRMLLLHAERLCMAAETIFSGTGVNISAKLAGMHWPYCTQTRLSQLVAGYYKFSDGNGYFPIASIFGRYGLTLCCKYFGLVDREESRVNRSCSPEEYIGQLQLVARTCDIDLEGENIGEILDDEPFQKVLNLSKYDSDGLGKPSFSFNFVRMNGNLYEQNNWLRFVRFVRQMSDTGFFQAKLDSGGFVICQYSSLASLQVGSAFA